MSTCRTRPNNVCRCSCAATIEAAAYLRDELGALRAVDLPPAKKPPKSAMKKTQNLGVLVTLPAPSHFIAAVVGTGHGADLCRFPGGSLTEYGCGSRRYDGKSRLC